MEDLFKRGVIVNILNMGIIDNSPTGSLIFTIFSAFAQFERDMIVVRTEEGKTYARLHNPDFHEGRNKTYSDELIEEAYQLHESGMTLQQISQKMNISRSTLYRRFKKLIK